MVYSSYHVIYTSAKNLLRFREISASQKNRELLKVQAFFWTLYLSHERATGSLMPH